MFIKLIKTNFNDEDECFTCNGKLNTDKEKQDLLCKRCVAKTRRVVV